MDLQNTIGISKRQLHVYPSREGGYLLIKLCSNRWVLFTNIFKILYQPEKANGDSVRRFDVCQRHARYLVREECCCFLIDHRRKERKCDHQRKRMTSIDVIYGVMSSYMQNTEFIFVTQLCYERCFVCSSSQCQYFVLQSTFQILAYQYIYQTSSNTSQNHQSCRPVTVSRQSAQTKKSLHGVRLYRTKWEIGLLG
ncbi:Hypothetical_protein [Hexamita inflata]|uniref:Hypothetical_protein n=1 Tax=Hexamita inflata TaxID=28002 RepID=A0ABP1HYT2_9EUKA